MTAIESSVDLPVASAPGAAIGLQIGRVTLGFVGTGAVGSALVSTLRAAGLPVVATWTRHRALPLAIESVEVTDPQQVADRADIVFITVPDSAITAVAAAIRWRTGQVAVHCSGAHGPGILAAASAQGAASVALHPLYSFPRSRQTAIPPGVRFAFTGPDELRPTFAGLVKRVGGRLIDLPADARATYHAAAILACNYTVTLAAASVALLESIGVEREAALAALLPLMQGTIDNLATSGLPAALTGPVVRGDIATVTEHRRTLRDTPFAAMYDVLAQATATVALERRDLSDEQRSGILALQSRPKGDE